MPDVSSGASLKWTEVGWSLSLDMSSITHATNLLFNRTI